MLDSAKKRFPEGLENSYSTITGLTSSSSVSSVSICNGVNRAYNILQRKSATEKWSTPLKEHAFYDSYDEWEVFVVFVLPHS